MECLKKWCPRWNIMTIGVLALCAVMCVWAEESADEDEPVVSPIIATDTYDFIMRLNVPQVVNNTQSNGKRIWQKQNLRGYLNVEWREDGTVTMSITGLVNRKFKVAGKNMTYTCNIDSNVTAPRLNYLGDNAKNLFRDPAISFYLEALPAYATTSPDADNSFYLMVAGKGRTKIKNTIGARIVTKMRGNVSGTQGCGCAALGHKSPTRRGGVCGATGVVDDVVATYGTWRATFLGRKGDCGACN